MHNFKDIKRVVIKIGTNVLTTDTGIDFSYLESIASQVSALTKLGYQVLLVSSGAIGVGAKVMGICHKINKIKLRQACAAIGQPQLMHQYDMVFSKNKLTIAQILLSRETLNNRDSFLNLRNSVETLLEMGVIPIFNENDSISTSEIGLIFGDNDSLSAHIASKLDAGLLVLLTDIDALYNGNPKENPEAHPISVVDGLTPEIESYAGGSGSEFSTGGMITKLKAVKIAERAGCRVVLADGREPRILERILDGEVVGTLFLAKKRLNSRVRWIMNTVPTGTIRVDSGAIKALRRNKSLLPSGILSIEGIFHEGDVVYINDEFKAVTSMNSKELEQVMGHHSSDIPKLLGENHRDDVARPEDIVVIE